MTKSLKMIKTAAMFGLDARIALAIFGALSVISGAALYSAIQESKVTALITELNEVGKSFEAYLLDTGESLPLNVNTYNAGVLTENQNTVKGWSGPYLSYPIHSLVNAFLDHQKYDAVAIFNRSESDVWGATTSPSVACVNDCRVFVSITNVEKAIADKIDEKLDGVIGADTGRVRSFYASPTHSNIYYAYMIDPYNK